MSITYYLVAQELPPITAFTTNDYKAEAQNWSISQSPNKFIYVANNSGLLEYNGAKWKLYPSPNESIVRSVKVINKKIYTGCYMEFGYWEKNKFGNLIYNSLSNSINEKLLEDEEFWTILEIDKWVVFQSLNRLYVYDTLNKNIEIIDSNTRLTKVFNVNETIYYQSLGEGIKTIKNGEVNLVTDDNIVKNNIVVNMFSIDSKLILLTQNKGFYQFNDNNLEKWSIVNSNTLESKSVYSGIVLDDGSLAIGTISNGLILLNNNGEVIYEIDQISGLSNNTVLSLFEDEDNNLWLGLDNGINLINFRSPFTIYNDYRGLLGTTYASIIHNDLLYVGTNQGLFYRGLNSRMRFKFIDGTKGQVWSLKVIDDTLFCGHNNGTYIVENYEAELISPEEGTWDLFELPKNNNLIIQGNYNGLFVLEKRDNIWSLRNKIKGFDNSSKHFQIANDSVLLVSHEYKGVFKVIVDENYRYSNKTDKVSGVDKGANSSLVKFNDTIYYAYKDGFFKYIEDEDKFIKDSILSNIYTEDEYSTGKLVVNKKDNTLWAFSPNYLYSVSKGSFSNKPKIDKIVFPNTIVEGISGYENISYLGDNKYLLGSTLGFIVLDKNKIQENQYSININKVFNKSIKEDYKPVFIDSTYSFRPNNNYFHFEYSIPSFDKFYQAEYQYKLDGIYNEWSNWSKVSSHSFENLPAGNYTFKVRGRIGNTLASNLASFTFTIEKQFYASNTAIIIYIFLLIGFSLFMHNLYRSYYRKKQKKLLEETERELELKKLENKQQLMHFKNEKLEQDIENKNRELAISTMSLIKKNEFLNKIKSELLTNNNESKNIIRLIDSNINNKDDWNFFEEAFNNADKDFLKKVKSKHPGLTPNDLKLCAYLRLNLSSKEIAPLLNISVKSVEVKRYRLRKKMNLPHEYSLTNHILEI